MSVSLKHRPYDGSTQPFEIALRPLDLKNWIEVDENLPRYLNEKHRVNNQFPDKTFVAEENTDASQDEVLNLLIPHLLEHYPDEYHLSQNNKTINIWSLPGTIELDDEAMPDLLKAALLVQEDLVIMRKDENGWRLVAASVCFPSSWVLAEKFSKRMHEIHAPVPGFCEGARNASMIERIFDNLLVEKPVERFNWSVYSDDALYHDDRAGEHFLNYTLEQGKENFLRIEHQTLRRLPQSGDILFTIGIHIDPLSMLANRDDRGEIIGEFITTLKAMTPEQIEYKGFDQGCDMLIERLKELAA